jgi:hypothetical protein
MKLWQRKIEVLVNGVPAGTFTRFALHRDGKYLLRLIRIDVSSKPHTLTAVAHYSYLLEIEKHTGYVVVILNLFNKSWLINIGRRQFYVQRINQETE